jgi:hypothetical protein
MSIGIFKLNFCTSRRLSPPKWLFLASFSLLHPHETFQGIAKSPNVSKWRLHEYGSVQNTCKVIFSIYKLTEQHKGGILSLAACQFARRNLCLLWHSKSANNYDFRPMRCVNSPGENFQVFTAFLISIIMIFRH